MTAQATDVATAVTGAEAAGTPRLELRDITKEYPGIRALGGVSLQVAPGEIVGLVGHNGAGKSTLSKVIAGLERADTGEMAIDGEAVAPHSAQDAIGMGVGLVPQRLAVVPSLSVRDNLTLGLRVHRRRAGGADTGPSVDDVAAQLGIEDILDKRADRLRPAAQRLVSIGRTLLRSPRLLILDEPSAAFSSAEVERLFEIVHRLRDHGIAVIYVSHRLDEVLALVDRVVAMAQGVVIANLPATGLGKGRLADLIAGRHVEALAEAIGRRPSATPGGDDGVPALRCAGVEVAPKLRGIDLELRRGEIIGLTGLVGSGRTSLLNALWGVAGKVTAGTVEVAGEPFSPSSPRAAIRRGIAYVPENRARNSLVQNLTVTENVTLPAVRSYRRGRLPLVSRRRERAAVRQMTERLTVHPPDAGSRAIGTLSGGNQQKAIIARWLLLDVDVFLFDEPTEGVDVGGREDIYGTLRALAADGKSVLVSSSDVEEVVEQCSRVLIMREGAIAEVIEGDALTVDRVSRACIA
jgi:ABC-type sugar transport system ATPase subunit